jgi:hypothetical protein
MMRMHHIHGAAAHAAVEQAVQRGAHFARLDPVVGRTGILFLLAADKGAVLHARHVARMRTREIGVRPQLLVQPDEGARGHQLAA